MDRNHQTYAHWMPDDARLDLIKLNVRHPYMVKALHLYFESEDFKNYLTNKYGNHDLLVRTYLGLADPALFLCVVNNLTTGHWCTLNKYKIIPDQCRKVYKKTNVFFDLEDICCDLDLVEQSPMITLSFDCEMVSKKDLKTGKYRFPRPINSAYDTWNYGVKKAIQTEAKRTLGKPDTQDPGDPNDVDPVVIINALVYQIDALGDNVLKKARSFVFKHPQAEPIGSLQAWREKIRQNAKDWLKEMFPDSTVPVDLISYWGYDKLEIEEHATEMDIIYAFENFIHEEDIDVITGWNIDFFDFPFLFHRWIYHCKVLQNPNLRRPNFGLLVGGESSLKSIQKKNTKVKEGASVKTGKSYISVTTPHLCFLDGMLIWRTKYAGKDTPHTLNSVSSKNLTHTLAALSAAANSVISFPEPGDGEGACAGASDQGSDAPGWPEKKVVDLIAEAVQSSNPDSARAVTRFFTSGSALDRFTLRYLKTSLIEEVCKPGGGFSFPMKKVEFKHYYGERYWKTGGEYLLRFSLYCNIDCVLPALLLKAKGIIFSVLSFCMITGVNIDDIMNRGQQVKVNAIVLREAWNMKCLPYDKGYHHYHWPCIFRHPLGCDMAVLSNFPRLGPRPDGASNEGGCVQKPYIYGVVKGKLGTKDAASMYPSNIHTANLCPSSFLTRSLIEHYGIPRYHYGQFVLGSAATNFAGELTVDHELAMKMGVNTDYLKLTFFHQRKRGVLPKIVTGLAGKRGKSKTEKGLWNEIYEYFSKKLKEEELKETEESQQSGGRPKLSIESLEIQRLSEEGWDTTDMEGLIKRLGLDAASQAPFTGEPSDYPLYLSLQAAIDLLKSNPVLVSFLKRVGSYRVACPATCKDMIKSQCLIMISTFKYISSLSEEDVMIPMFMRLSQAQYENYDLHQLEVKCGMNSLYGVFMKASGAYSLPEVGATVTTLGRTFITFLKCLLERQTTQNAKERLGLSGDSEVPDPSILAAHKVEPSERYFPAGKAIRRLPPCFVSRFQKCLRSQESAKAVYGDTDSIMVKYAPHNVVTVEQSFKVMRYFVELVNWYFENGFSSFKMLRFEDEKISMETIIYQMKRYDMYAIYKQEKSKLKLLPAGSNKSDTLPFVNTLMSATSEEFLRNVSFGYSIKEATEKLVYEVKKGFLLFSTGQTNHEELTTSVKIKTFDPDRPHSIAAKVAVRMLQRGVPVCSGDKITYINVVNELTGAEYPEEFEYFTKNMDTLSPDLLFTWEKKIKKKMISFLRHIVVPLRDITLLHTVYSDTQIEKDTKQCFQLDLQAEYLGLLLFSEKGDVEGRLNNRRQLRRECQEIEKKKMWATSMEKKESPTVPKLTFPRELECLICFKHFDPKVYEILDIAPEPGQLSRQFADGGNRYDQDTDFRPKIRTSQMSTMGRSRGSFRKTGNPGKKRGAPGRSKTVVTTATATMAARPPISGLAAWLNGANKLKNEVMPLKNECDRTVKMELENERDVQTKGTPVDALGVPHNEPPNASTRIVKTLEDLSSIHISNRVATREHIKLEYDSNTEIKPFPGCSVKHVGEHHRICVECMDKKEENSKTYHNKRKTKFRAFLRLRAQCLLCIAVPCVPVDSYAPDTPESCTMTECSIYKEKKSVLYEIQSLENVLTSLGEQHNDW